ncbi:peptide chain release factor N(5)-glutamine methyltransferase [Buchnera aphidicola]|uniref:peptide chain release factor N(5)-glutamine methyltransferase n=1 Tax=Buchnera aphidicola TaxID=9 RepID=UPI003463BF99
MMTVYEWLRYATEQLSSCGYYKLDAEVLLSFVIKKSKSWLIINENYRLNMEELKKINYLLKRRMLGEPIAYLLGEKEFWSLTFIVSKFVLIPRSDTEILVEHSLKKLTDTPSKILDLGTGCGSIALSLAAMRSDCDITGIDCMMESIYLAKYNANRLRINNVRFLYSNWFSVLGTEKFDIIVSNPPYVKLEDINFLEKDIFFEPFISLISSNNGLADIEHIIKYAKKHLNYLGWLLLEHSYDQKEEVQNIFKHYNFFEVSSYKDYSGNDRITIGRNI